MGPLETANLNHWKTYFSITTATYTPEIRVCQREMTRSLGEKTVILSVIQYHQNPLESKSPMF
jgi:hypothetical protein